MPDDKFSELQQCYRNVFSTMEGQKVIGDILTLGHFGETMDPANSSLVAEYNLAITIARMAGVLDPLYEQLGMAVGKE
jgi:hypothetical protein